MMASNRNKKLLAIFNSEHSIWGITLLLIVILAFVHPQYRSINNYMNVLREASMLGIAGLGLMGVIMTRNTDLSIGTMMALASVVMLKIMPEVGMIPAMLICILLCVGLELLNGFLIVYCNIFAFILTLGMRSVDITKCFRTCRKWISTTILSSGLFALCMSMMRWTVWVESGFAPGCTQMHPMQNERCIAKR